MDNENIELTKEQRKEVFKRLSEENADADKLEAARKAAEESDETELGKIEFREEAPVQTSKEAFKSALSEYNITDQQAEDLINLIIEYRKTNKIPAGIEKKLPIEMNTMIMEMTGTPTQHGKITKKEAIRFVLNSFINDANLDQILIDYENELNAAYVESNEELNGFVNSKYEELFASIDKIAEEDPERAGKITKVRDAYKLAESFALIRDYITDHIKSLKRTKKDLQFRYDSRKSYFNTRMKNSTELSIPDINLFEMAILGRFEDVEDISANDVKMFVLITADFLLSLPMDMDENIFNTALVYKTIEQIVSYGYASPAALSEEFIAHGNKLFGNIEKCIREIQNKK